MIKKEGNKYSVWSESGKKRLGKPGSKAQAVKRLRQVEYFKHHPEKAVDSSSASSMSSHVTIKKSYAEFLKKSIVSDHIDQNKTVPTRKIFLSLGLDYKKFMGIE